VATKIALFTLVFRVRVRVPTLRIFCPPLFRIQFLTLIINIFQNHPSLLPRRDLLRLFLDINAVSKSVQVQVCYDVIK